MTAWHLRTGLLDWAGCPRVPGNYFHSNTVTSYSTVNDLQRSETASNAERNFTCGRVATTEQAALADGAKLSTLARLRKVARDACSAVQSQLQSRRSSSEPGQGGKQLSRGQRCHPIVEAALASLET